MRTRWLEEECAPPLPGNAFIAGHFTPAASGRVYDNINPATGKVINHVARCDATDVDRAVAAARKAFERGVWAQLSPSERKRVLLRLADLIEANIGELALLESLDVGKPLAISREVEMPDVVSFVRWLAEALDKLYGEIAPWDEATLD